MTLEGQTLGGRYLLEHVLGDGGMGVVYQARDLTRDTPVAVKIMHRKLMRDPTTVLRFQREAAILMRLQHPNVIETTDHGLAAHSYFTVMELATGTPLTLLMSGPLAKHHVITIMEQLLAGLGHAHDAGLLHRDLKPENVIVDVADNGAFHVRLLDFGIAVESTPELPSALDRLTEPGEVLGTPEFMAPEQAAGEVVDLRTDLFALGIICYMLLTGVMPFDGTGIAVTIANMTMPTPPMHVRAPDVEVDPKLEAFTQWLLQKAPHDRPRSAREAREWLLAMSDENEAALARDPSGESTQPIPLAVALAKSIDAAVDFMFEELQASG